MNVTQSDLSIIGHSLPIFFIIRKILYRGSSNKLDEFKIEKFSEIG